MIVDLDIDTFTYPDVALPDVWTVEQLFDTPTLPESAVSARTVDAVRALVKSRPVAAGAQIAVGVGSRGVDNLVTIVRSAVAELRALGLRPFIVPAMGSHGGATAEGQIDVLHSYGITPEAIGAEIRATMDVEQIGILDSDESDEFAGHPIYWERNALAADAVILINRVKAHTDFTGDIESGIAKMSVIGLGKRHGAESIHHYGARGLRDLMPRIGRWIAGRMPILGGIAVIENELGRTAEVHAVPAVEIGRAGEQALLRRARATAPRLPFSELDILVIDEMGKNISGAGMDTHVIGRGAMPSIAEEGWGGPNIRLIAVLDLTAASHGNATALGLADLTTRRLVEKVDFRSTFINMRTSGEGGVLRGRLPLIMPTSDDCVRTAMATCGRRDPAHVRLARIRNTADTQFLEISAGLVPEARACAGLRVSGSGRQLDLCRAIGTQ